MKLENSTLVFDSGRRLDAPFDMIGLDVTLRTDYGSLLGGGQDTTYPIVDPTDPESTLWHPDAFTAAECVDLADFMIERWAAFRAMHAPPLAALSNDEADRVRGDLAAVSAAFRQAKTTLDTLPKFFIDHFAALKDFKL